MRAQPAQQLYVHRSGRTARAAASGLSVMLVGPDDMKTYRQICSVLRNGNRLLNAHTTHATQKTRVHLRTRVRSLFCFFG